MQTRKFWIAIALSSNSSSAQLPRAARRGNSRATKRIISTNCAAGTVHTKGIVLPVFSLRRFTLPGKSLRVVSTYTVHELFTRKASCCPCSLFGASRYLGNHCVWLAHTLSYRVTSAVPVCPWYVCDERPLGLTRTKAQDGTGPGGLGK